MSDPVMSGLDPTLPLEVFENTTISTGGDSSLYNLNVFYNVRNSVLSIDRIKTTALTQTLLGG